MRCPRCGPAVLALFPGLVLTEEEKYDVVIVGAGVAGRAALRELKGSVAVIDSDRTALLEAGRISTATLLEGRATRIHCGLRRLHVDSGLEIQWERLILAIGAPAPYVPEDMVDPQVRAKIAILGGRGRDHDDAVMTEAILRARHQRVVIIGSGWPAVQLALRCPGATLICADHGPLAARAPRWLSAALRKRLSRAGVQVKHHHQIRYVGASGTSVRVYMGKTYDALSTSAIDCDFIVVAGAEFTYQTTRGSPDDERCAPRGAAMLMSDAVKELDLTRPIAVNDEVLASSTVLCCGDCAATPSRLLATPYLSTRGTTEIAAHAGYDHARISGTAAGKHVTESGPVAAKVLRQAGPPCFLCSDPMFSCAFVGRCDSDLQVHSFFPDRSDTSITFFLASNRIVGVLLWGADLADDVRITKAKALLDDHQIGGSLRLAAHDLLGSPHVRFQHRMAISRAERLGPTYSPGAGTADLALFSRGRNISMPQKRQDAYTAGILEANNPDSVLPRHSTLQRRGSQRS